MKYRIYGRRLTEVNTDPQRRCYNGCHFSSEWIWSDWYHLGTVKTEQEAIESVALWKEVNPRRHDYKYIAVEQDAPLVETIR